MDRYIVYTHIEITIKRSEDCGQHPVTYFPGRLRLDDGGNVNDDDDINYYFTVKG